MMRNSLKSSFPVVIPMEALRSANTLAVGEANRPAIPFVSPEQFQTPEPGAKPGNTGESLFVPIIVGAHAPNRAGERMARLIMAAMAGRDGVESAILSRLDLAAAPAALQAAAAMILVVPEYNYGYPDMLERLLATNLANKPRRVIGICDLAPGWFGGTRLLEALLPMMRKYGVLPIFWNGNYSNCEVFFNSTNDKANCAGLDNFLSDFLNLATLLHRHSECCIRPTSRHGGCV